jgi:NAD dependent epimerase/dehydratase
VEEVVMIEDVVGDRTGLIAVTGADGFIGSHLVELLVERGYRVRALVQYNAFASWGWLETLPKEILGGVDVVMGDVRDPSGMRAFLDGASIIYHLAALIAIPYSYRSPRTYLETNVLGTLNVLEAARDLGTPRVVQTSTSEVYGTARIIPITESHPLQTQSPYAASKSAADHLAESFHLSYGLPVVTLRPFNTYGPRQSARAVIPTVIAQLHWAALEGGPTEIKLGALDPTRDFLFVRDTVAAFVAVGEAPLEKVVGQVFNAGTGLEVSIHDLVTRIAAVMGREVRVVQDPQRLRPSDSEVMRLVCDASKLRQATGWEPKYALDDGLRATAAWFEHAPNLERTKADIYHV